MADNKKETAKTEKEETKAEVTAEAKNEGKKCCCCSPTLHKIMKYMPHNWFKLKVLSVIFNLLFM